MEEIMLNVWAIAGILFGGSIVIQIVPIKINPWTFILKRVGKIMNEDTDKKVTEVMAKMEDLEDKVGDMEEKREMDRAMNARRRILRFSDECIRKEQHSKEYFDNVLEDISEYKRYCEDHPKFKNEKCVLAVSNIEKAYNHCLEYNDFL